MSEAESQSTVEVPEPAFDLESWITQWVKDTFRIIVLTTIPKTVIRIQDSEDDNIWVNFEVDGGKTRLLEQSEQ